MGEPSFFHSKMWFADITCTYYDWNYLDIAPSRRMQSLYTDNLVVDGVNYNVNGSYKDINAVTDKVDKFGTPILAYPYNLVASQESLASSNVWHRFIFDASVGKLLYLPNRQQLSINLSVTNFTNNTHLKTGGYQQARLARATKQGEPNGANSTLTPNVWKFPSKYYYAWGTNFYLSLTYKF